MQFWKKVIIFNLPFKLAFFMKALVEYICAIIFKMSVMHIMADFVLDFI